MLAVLEVMEITIIAVGLTLKAYVAIGVTFEQQPDEPLDDIHHIEEHIQHLAHLSSVDALMVDEALAQPNPGVNKEHSKEIHRREAARWRQIFAANYLHL